MKWGLVEDGALLDPLQYHSFAPVKASAASHGLSWAGIEAVRYSDLADAEIDQPPLTHHALILFTDLPDELDLYYEEVERHRPPPIGSISVVPAGTPTRWRWRGTKSSLHVYLEPELIARIAAEAFGLDPARWALPPLDSLDLPQLRDILRAVNAELTTAGAGGPLAAESLANILAVHLIRYVVAPLQTLGRRDGTMPRRRLRAVLEYIEENLDAPLALADIAAVTGLNPYHFARQFKAATGMPPHQYVIMRRVERAKQLLRVNASLSMAEVAARAGFYDQSQFSRHFKRLVGVTPSQFRTLARID